MTELIANIKIQFIQMPHICNPPKSFTGNAASYSLTSPEDFYRAKLFNVVDIVDVQLSERFKQGGLETLAKLEEVLLSGEMDAAVVDQYPELNRRSLEVQLAMFKMQYQYKTSTEAASVLRNQLPEVCSVFDQAEALILMVDPASSSEAKRSFSSLRRKTWLRSALVQSSLNHVAACHIHWDKLDELDMEKVCQLFVFEKMEVRTDRVNT